MSLLQLRYEEWRAGGVSCEVFVNPATDATYAIAYVKHKKKGSFYFPVTPMFKGKEIAGINPIPVDGKPGMVHACDTRDEAYRVLEVYDAVQG